MTARPSDEELGRMVRDTWVAWAREQPDTADHPSWTRLWDALSERDKDADRRIGRALFDLGALTALKIHQEITEHMP